MKAGIITFHYAHNYGAMLQAVALQEYLEKRGCETEIIDYIPAYAEGSLRVTVSPLRQAKNAFRAYSSKPPYYKLLRASMSFGKAIVGNAFYLNRLSKSRKFEIFKHKNMKLSPKCHSFEDLKKISNRYDIVFCGSDQIWNPHITGEELDPAYFGMFAGKHVKVVSYAASACELAGSAEKEKLSMLTDRMDEISLREKNQAEELYRYVNKAIRTDVDPTLLLTEKDYLNLEEKTDDKAYILLYTLDDAESKKKAVNRALELSARNNGMKIMDISYSKSKLHNVNYKYIANPSPGEFLSIIKNAEYVVTNSFHGTSFSVIYHKNFWSAVHSFRGDRIISLLDALSIGNRVIDNNNGDICCPPEFDKTDALLRDLNLISQKYIEKNIN